MKIKGLNDKEVLELREKYGKNEIVTNKKESFIVKIIHIICEPMFLLLIAASTIYFVLGEVRDGLIMFIFIFGIIIIDIIQEWKTDKTLNALKDLSEPKIKVLRNNEKILIPSCELVPNDIMYVHEGVKIPADGYVLKCSGLKVDESSLTGESLGVFKSCNDNNPNDYWKSNYVYQGTLVEQGTGIIKVDKIGNETEYGKIGVNINKANSGKTPLEKQTDNLVKTCALIALVLFLLVTILTFINLSNLSFSDRLVKSILSGVTLAMSLIPEEYPVVLTVFLSMGAWRLAKKNSLVKKLPSVETLGAVSVLCVDKTGTITKNMMEVADVKADNIKEFITNMCLSCEEETYDPMEKAMFNYAKKHDIYKKDIFKLDKIKEYPFSNELKVVGSAWSKKNKVLLTIKGSCESIIRLCKLNEDEIDKIHNEVKSMQKRGLRVIGVASCTFSNRDELPDNLEDITLKYDGIVGLIDPPKESVIEDIKICNEAQVRVVMITGDNGITASSIAKSIGMKNTDKIITGLELDKMSDEELKEKIKDVSIFSRVIPEHKMRIVKAFQEINEVVAMTGDGVNDASALKQADIGIAMGRGSEVSKEAADLILLDDNFTTIVDTIKDGRKIYDNIKRAIEYILAIHIPIALSSLIAPILNIEPTNLLLLPLHIVILEVLIDPTCSVVLERQPCDTNIMKRGPRNINEGIVTKRNLLKSITQGFVIFLFSFITYYSVMKSGINKARTFGLLIIMFANIFLVQVNSSNYDYAYQSIKKLVKDKVMIISNVLVLLGIVLITYTPLKDILSLVSLNLKEMLLVIALAFLSVFWYEIVKFIKRRK